MLDAVVDYLPSPVDVPAINGILDDGKDTPAERHASDDEPFSALAFKIATDPFVGNLTFFRVYSCLLYTASRLSSSARRVSNVLSCMGNLFSLILQADST